MLQLVLGLLFTIDSAKSALDFIFEMFAKFRISGRLGQQQVSQNRKSAYFACVTWFDVFYIWGRFPIGGTRISACI